MIAIVDYGVGNLFSLSSSVRSLGAEVRVTRDAADLRAADHILLPGVGAFADAMAKLEATGLVPVLREETQKKPLLGICLGMQIMVMEYARNVLGYADANSSEFTPEGHHNVIDLMADQQGNIPKGGTMRLGKYPCTVKPGTKMAECYGEAEIWERHRHRYEFNNEFRQEMEDAGLVISGTSPDGRLVETCPAVTSIWAHSSTPSSRAAPTALIPCSRALSPPHSNSASMHSAA